MLFTVYLPPKVFKENSTEQTKVPALYWLSGLTCNDENFIQKAGAQKYAAEKGIALICPDTSPRNVTIEGLADDWDFGFGAGFYVNATEEKFAKNFNMYDYITKELPKIVEDNLPVTSEKSISGHSMGGHGSLVIALRNPGLFKSVSAFSPICNPINCAWGNKAFSGYLGQDKEKWNQYDATELIKSYSGPALNILIDQGTEDEFYHEKKQLLPENFEEAAKNVKGGTTVNVRRDANYDHSYFFVASFIEDHINHHAKYLSQ